jgi:outer membrane receptor protein involved in Fe transport
LRQAAILRAGKRWFHRLWFRRVGEWGTAVNRPLYRGSNVAAALDVLNYGFDRNDMRDKEFNAGLQAILAGETSDLRGRRKASVPPSCASSILLFGLGLFAAAAVSAAETSVTDLTLLPIEKLMEMEVTILRGHESLSQTPAAVSIVTQEDIRRSGATSIPEALRLVPGLEVARVDASQWAISARGFNDVFANKLLVLQDGRSIYSPVFSGVFWDVQGTMMDDIDRIEVIRGPGATLWGANAVNGVINIITKKAKDTQGVLASAGGGSQDRGFVNVRYGGRIGDQGFFRVYGTCFDHDNFPLRTGGDAAWGAPDFARTGICLIRPS